MQDTTLTKSKVKRFCTFSFTRFFDPFLRLDRYRCSRTDATRAKTTPTPSIMKTGAMSSIDNEEGAAITSLCFEHSLSGHHLERTNLKKT